MLAQLSTEAFELILFDLSTCSNHEPSELNFSLHWSTPSCVPSRLACVWKSFSDSKFNLFFHVSYFLNVAAVVRFKQRLALSDAADALETIKSQSPAPLCLVSLCNRVPKHQNKGATLVEVGPSPHSSKCLSPKSSGICCVPTDSTRRGTREQKKVTERGGKREREHISSSYSLPLPELKMDSWRNASMAVSRDCDCSPPSNTWDSFTLVGHSDGATNTRPPQERKRRGGREGLEWVGVEMCHYYNASVSKVE